MTALPTLNIPVTVNTSGVDPAMRKVEARMKKSAERISKIRGAATPALGAVGGGAVGGLAGGLGQLGGFGAAASIGMIGASLPVMAASRLLSAMKDSTNGASEALARFQKTGELLMGANSIQLRQLAMAEAGYKGVSQTTLGGAFLTGSRGASGAMTQPGELEQKAMDFGTVLEGYAAWWGAFLSGGSRDMADLQRELAMASEYQAQEVQKRINATRDFETRFSGRIAADPTNPWNNVREQQMLEQLRQMNGKM